MVLQVSYKFARLPDAPLYEFSETVASNMAANPAFPNLPLDATVAMLLAANAIFLPAMETADMGGEMDTTAKNVARQTVLGLLRKLAGYVQITANTMVELLSSGFEARDANSARVARATPTGVMVKNGVSTQLIARIDHPVENCNMYEGRASVDGGVTWLPSVFTGDSRHIIFNGLIPGKTYTIQIRALGGLTGQSDWSDPVTHMSM